MGLALELPIKHGLEVNNDYSFSGSPQADSACEPLSKDIHKQSFFKMHIKSQSINLFSKWMVFAAIAAYLIYQLSKTGWSEIYAALKR